MGDFASKSHQLNENHQLSENREKWEDGPWTTDFGSFATKIVTTYVRNHHLNEKIQIWWLRHQNHQLSEKLGRLPTENLTS